MESGVRGIGIAVCVGRSVYPLLEKSQAERPVQTAGASVALIFRGLPLGNRSGWDLGREPRGSLDSGEGKWDWTDEPYSEPRLSPRACLNRQAGFTASRPPMFLLDPHP